MGLFSKDKAESPKEPTYDWFIPEDGRKYLSALFEGLRKDVELKVFTKKGENDPYNEYMIRFVKDLSKLSEKIKPEFFDLLGDGVAKQWDVEASPTLLLNPQEYKIRFLGTPLGEEGRSFMEAILLVSRGESGLSSASKEMLKSLAEPRHIRVFTNPG